MDLQQQRTLPPRLRWKELRKKRDLWKKRQRKHRKKHRKPVKVNDIHHEVRLVSVLDKTQSLSFDIISVVLDHYRSRLKNLPKPLKDLFPFEGRNLNFDRVTCDIHHTPIFWEYFHRVSPMGRCRGKWIAVTGREKWRSEMKSERNWKPRDLSVQTNDPIPRGFKGVYEENIKLTKLLISTESFGTGGFGGTNLSSIVRRNRHYGRKPIDMIKVEKQL
jgi:hypothetical protein